jgi:hypothetical protein
LAEADQATGAPLSPASYATGLARPDPWFTKSEGEPDFVPIDFLLDTGSTNTCLHPSEPSLLGMDILRQFRVSVDYVGLHVSLE